MHLKCDSHLPQEDVWKRAHVKLESKLETKLDSDEVQKLKRHFRKQMRELNHKLKQQQMMAHGPVTGAAGLKRRIYNCLSCDKPAVIPQTK